MKKTKTKVTKVDVFEFINSFVENDKKKEDSFQLIKFMRDWSGSEPKMWGDTIIGFANYDYKYSSGHHVDMPLIIFSPRKTALSLYVFSPTEENKHLLNDFGKFRIAKACFYIKNFLTLISLS